MPLHEPSPYEVLGVPLTADAREIKAAEASAAKTASSKTMPGKTAPGKTPPAKPAPKPSSKAPAKSPAPGSSPSARSGSAPSQPGRYARQQIQESSRLLRDPDRRWEIDVQQPLPPDTAAKALDVLAPLLDEPLWSPGSPPLPPVTTLVTLRRDEVEAEFADPPVIGLGEEPEIPARVTAGLSVLPHVEFPA